MANPLADIAAIIRTVLCDASLDIIATTHFEQLTDWDFMDLIAVVVEVECMFSVQFEVYDIDRLVTVDDLVRMVAVKQALAAA